MTLTEPTTQGLFIVTLSPPPADEESHPAARGEMLRFAQHDRAGWPRDFEKALTDHGVTLTTSGERGIGSPELWTGEV